MAKITINEISQNYMYNIGNNSFATVALPITASWGPGYFDPETYGIDRDAMLESTVWQRFPATQAGLESFIATYRGPIANFRTAGDYSYQMAMTLLTAGYDVLVCRLSAGAAASGTVTVNKPAVDKEGKPTTETVATIAFKAKYPGTFGNNLSVKFLPVPGNSTQYQMLVKVKDAANTETTVENLICCLNEEDATDTVCTLEELESKFVTINIDGEFEFDPETDVTYAFDHTNATLTGGMDYAKLSKDVVADGETKTTELEAFEYVDKALELAKSRFNDNDTTTDYCKALTDLISITVTKSEVEGEEDTRTVKAKDGVTPNLAVATRMYNKEWIYYNVLDVYNLLTDKLSYSPQRIISPGWDDQDISAITGTAPENNLPASPLHKKLLAVAKNSRCGTALLDVPKCLSKTRVHGVEKGAEGYAQTLARSVNGLDATNAALQAPWGTYAYVGTNKKYPAPPSFLMLLMHRAMLLNQATQYEWALPSNRKQNIDVGTLDYVVGKAQLDTWQASEGVGVNAIANVPGLGTTIWGNSTLYEVPPATYQALANLSTRYLVNAVKDIVYRVGINITYQYNNAEAYSNFYAGVTPLLDTMRNVGAIDGYEVQMSADINGLDQVNANTVVGKIYLIVNGVVNDIVVDLTALPPGTDLTQFAG